MNFDNQPYGGFIDQKIDGGNCWESGGDAGDFIEPAVLQNKLIFQTMFQTIFQTFKKSGSQMTYDPVSLLVFGLEFIYDTRPRDPYYIT